MFNNNYDFKYSEFPISTETLEGYINEAIHFKQKYQKEHNQYNHALGIVDSIISCILSDDFDFNPNNKRIFKLLYKMLRDCGHENGKYSDNARRALQKLCKFCGFSENAIELVDQKPVGRFEKIKRKISGWFASNTKEDSNKDTIVDEIFANKEQNKNEYKQKNDTPIITSTIHTDDSDTKKAEPVFDCPKQTNNTSDEKSVKTNLPKFNVSRLFKFSKFAATFTGGMIVTSMLFADSTNKNNTVTNINENSVKALKVTTPTSTAHYESVTTYNWADSTKTQKSVLTKENQSVAQNKYTPATDSVSVKLTATSRSALNILMGTEKAQKLCDDVKAKFDAGIFNLPEGMSIERVAHAMQMSRIYEGNSIILYALNSDKKLTDAQQRAFNKHIADIGDLGVKLQKRMAAKHKLSNYNHYKHAKKSLREAHAKNLKQLKQAKKHMQQYQK